MKGQRRAIGLTFIALLMGAGALRAGGVLYVDADAVGANDGSSWANAYTSLQSALTAATPGTQIRVAQGTYKPSQLTTPGDAKSATFQLLDSVLVQGGYAGFGEPVPDELDAAAHPTVLSGDIGVAGSTADNAYHVVRGSGANASAVLDGFIVTLGNAGSPGFTDMGVGGGLIVATGSPTVRNCTFKLNLAGFAGGGVYSDSTSFVLVDCRLEDNDVGVWGGGGFAGKGRIAGCTFQGNDSAGQGGAVLSEGLEIDGCTFTDNTAGHGIFGGGPGGALYGSFSTLNVADSTFEHNLGQGRGGAIAIDGGFGVTTLTVTRCDFIDNALNGFGSFNLVGGAIGARQTDVVLAECRFEGNDAPLASAGYAGRGGAVSLEDSPAEITGCIFAGNQAETNNPLLLHGFGGGVYSENSDPVVTNCVFIGNIAGSGGGFYSTSESAAFFHGAFALNVSDFLFMAITGVGGIDAGGGGGGAPYTLSNCILWKNLNALGATTEGVQLTNSVGVALPDHCCIEGLTGALGGAGNFSGNPHFEDFDGADNVVGTLDDDLRLRADSPCIDAGTNVGQPADTADLDLDGDTSEVAPLDLDRTARNADITTVADTGVGPAPVTDMGAYERSAWTNLGEALDGASGKPCLVAHGTLAAGSSLSLTVTNVLPGASSYLILSAAPANAPFKGGIMVPEPDPPSVIAAITTGPGGQSTVGGTWPAVIPSGFTLYAQWWAVDPASPAGASASNAIAGVTP
jgi:hypothetical protein